MLKTIFMGTPDFAVPILEELIKLSDVALVVTKPDATVGRKKILSYPPIKELAIKNNIEVFQPIKIKQDYDIIKEINPDLIVTCAYGQILSEEILNIPRLGCINVHASLLPKYRGGAPIHRAIINGEEETGVTIMYMDKGMDTGDIIKIESIKIEDNDTTESLHDKLSILGSKLLREVFPLIESGTNKRIKQNEDEATTAPLIKREDEHLDFKNNVKDVANKVRGLYSWPLANFILDDEEIKVLEGYIGEESNKESGIIANIKKDAIGIMCSDKIYYITKLKPSGKKAMLVKDYLNGINKEKLLNKKVL